MLEDTVSGMGLAATGAAVLGRPVTAEDIFAAAGPGTEAARIVEGFLSELSLHLVNLAIAVDPQRVAVGGGISRAWPRLYPPLEQALKAGVPFPPELVQAAHHDASLIGALSLGLEAAGAVPSAYPADPAPVPATRLTGPVTHPAPRPEGPVPNQEQHQTPSN